MTWMAPWWLAALAPFALVAVYLLWGRRPDAAVPFLDLWTGPVAGRRPKRRFAAPPVAVALALLSMLLAIVGAARPALWDPAGAAPVTVVVDRGATMSADGRIRDAAEAAFSEMSRLRRLPPVDLVAVPPVAGQRGDATGWAARAAQFPRTALNTTAILRAAIADRLVETAGPVVVITDKDVLSADPRVVRVTPRSAVLNAGITLVAARESPRPQVMVRVRGTTADLAAELRVSSAGREVVRPVAFAASGEATDHFIDFESLGDVVKAELLVADQFAGDNAAWLVREGGPPRIETRRDLPAELRRMIDVYAARRPPAAESARVVIVGDAGALPETSAGVVLADAREETGPGAMGVQVRPHAVTRDTRWSFRGPVGWASSPPAGWAPAVSVGGRVAVAVRESPARQVWVGIDSGEWPRTPEYVVFWANVFDWLGGGETLFASRPAEILAGGWVPVELAAGQSESAASTPPARVAEAGWWPGLYRRDEDGALRAVHAGDVRFAPPAGDDWRPALARVLGDHARGSSRPFAAAALLAAGGFAALSAAAWKRSPGRNLAPT